MKGAITMFAKILVENEKDEEWYAKFETFDDLKDFIEEQNSACTIYPPSMCSVPNKKCWLIIISKST